jgi:uncharacterized membrane protein
LLLLLSLVSPVMAFFELPILKYVNTKMGIGPRYVVGLLLLSLVGSYINIPVARLPAVQEAPGTSITVNVGGALIPTFLSIYLLIKNRLFLCGLAEIAFVTLVVHQVAQPVRGVGMSAPLLLPPLVAVLTAMLLSALLLSWNHAPQLAFIAGSIGTLIGADLLNLDKIHGLGASTASIGGAGTFDGIYLSGMLAVFLAPVGSPFPKSVTRKNLINPGSKPSPQDIEVFVRVLQSPSASLALREKCERRRWNSRTPFGSRRRKMHSAILAIVSQFRDGLAGCRAWASSPSLLAPPGRAIARG